MHSSTTMEGMNKAHILLLVFVGIVFVVAEGCLQVGDAHACDGLEDGDYNACQPDCQNGTFIKCSNEDPSPMSCPLGWYKKQLDPPTGTRAANIVYDPATKRCQYTSSSCPRDLDNYVLDDK